MSKHISRVLVKYVKSERPQTVKRVDDLWRHFEGLKADVEQLDRPAQTDPSKNPDVL